jgi:Do/DeqQ family serine protease
MKPRLLLRAAFIGLILAAFQGAALAQSPPAGREVPRQSFAPVVKKAAPAVVNVYSKRIVRTNSPFLNDPFFRRFFGDAFPLDLPRQRVMNSLGSGVIVDPSGLIVTNHHVIENAQQVTVVLSDRREFPAHIVLDDKQADLAVLRIDAGKEKLPTLPIGDSDQLEVGDIVLAIGNPFGVGQTVTSGIVSALARTGVGIGDFGAFIQTDAAINPGNSGGALVDLDGKLVGINTAIYSESGGSVGIGFAIPTGIVRSVLEAARKGQTIVHRPFLGVSGESVSVSEAKRLGLDDPLGVLVDHVAENSPAARADIVKGDVILAIDGHTVDDAESLRYRLATISIGSKTRFTLWRDGKTRETVATLIAPPEQPPRDVTKITGNIPLAGASVGNLNPAFAEELDLPQNQRGVVIADVAEGSLAERLGLQRGDRLLKLNDRKVESVAQLRDVIAGSQPPWTIVLGRSGKTLAVTVQ